ncbi:hypothetical protein GLX27_003817 [Malassezia furfur]|uniref:Cytochrome c oxidase assembly protein COX20, mitochondrial n=1 Tax=Malassezia furfur TaxID=55194 RepID=A0ABY8EUD7_MALFU|nr:hypothetical protein CBS14141_004060 [Malassezia furfur]WFD49139.1 hypothetical protein GLX27_003817 [Malassezia furfur]
MADPGVSRLSQPEAPSTPKAPSTTEVLRQVWSKESLEAFLRVPCARSSLLFAIASATSIGTIQALARRGVGRVVNWSVGTFLFISVVGWETCRRSRAAEELQMRRIKEEYARRRRGERKTAPAPPS